MTVAATSSVAANLAQQVFRSNVDGIIIPVSVTSGNRPVANLTAADFELRDNGVLQRLQRVDSEGVPLDLTLLLDLSSSVDGPELQRLKSAVSDTAALLHPSDRIRLVAISQVLHEVFGFRPRGGRVPLDGLAAEGATSLYDGLAATMMRPSDAGRRQLIVAFTDGRDSTSIIDQAAAAEIARLSDAMVDIVVPAAGQTRDPAQRRLAQRSGSIDALPGGNVVVGSGRLAPGGFVDTAISTLTELVKPTAGDVFVLPDDQSISRAFKSRLEAFRASYVLQYVPGGVESPGWHDVTVQVTRRGRFEVRARKGYRGNG